MGFKGDDLKQATLFVVILHHTANHNSHKNGSYRLWKDLESVNPVVGIKQEDAKEGYEQKEYDAHLHVFLVVMVLLDVFYVLTVVLRI